jgi:hypothetical protein
VPYKSQSQQKYFHYLESKGKLPKKTVKEFDESTDYNDLPEHARDYAYGGEVQDSDDPRSFDYDTGHAHDYDSSGEPHTEFEFEDEQPMEFMNRGGMIKRMASGGVVKRNPGFAKALRKMY